MARIAFIGLGNMGGPMAGNLVKAGHDVSGFDLSRNAVEAAGGRGVQPAPSMADAVSAADIVVTMLPAGAHVTAAYTASEGILETSRPEALLIDCSTIEVAVARAVAEAAAATGRAMLDAPVSGGVGGAEAATLTFMAGGTDADFAKARPILDAMGGTIVHCGASGAGQAAKICNNMILGVSMIAVAESFALADRLGLDRQKLFDVASKSSGQCWSMTTYCPVPGPVPTSPANRDYEAGFTAAMMLKDLKLSQAAAQEVAASTPLGAAAAALYQLYVSSGGEETDFSGIFRFVSGGVPAKI